MTFLNWTRDLDTGIDWIDEQHMKIVDYINELKEAKDSGNADGIGQIYDNLVDYTVTHFAEEESMMEAAGYRLTDLHKKIHEKFIAEVSGLHKRFKAGTDTTQELLEMLQHWLFSHIRSNDHGYIDIVKETGAAAR